MSHQLDRLASRYESRFEQAFRDEVATLRGEIDDQMVADVLRRGLADEPVAIYNLLEGAQVVKAQEDDAFASLIAGAGKLELDIQGQPRLVGLFNLTSPFVLEAARKQAANLVRGVKGESRKAIRRIIFEAIRDGDPPAKAARLIRQTIGLTERHAVAVQRFAANHTVAGTDRYARKLLNWRARNIARTETIRASRIGQQQAWKEMARDHLIDTSRFMQRWQVTDDDRLCDLCAPMEGMLVPLDGHFESRERGVLPSEREFYAGETVDGPPLHLSPFLSLRPRC